MAYRSRRERRRSAAEASTSTADPMMPPVSHKGAKRSGPMKHSEGKAARKHLGKARRSALSSAHVTDGPNGVEPAFLARGGGVPECDDGDADDRKSGGGINIKPSHKGLLHKDLGVAQGKPISTAKLEKAKEGASTAEKKRIVFAENARKWHHGG